MNIYSFYNDFSAPSLKDKTLYSKITFLAVFHRIDLCENHKY